MVWGRGGASFSEARIRRKELIPSLDKTKRFTGLVTIGEWSIFALNPANARKSFSRGPAYPVKPSEKTRSTSA